MYFVGDWAPGNNQVVAYLGGSNILANLEGPILSLDHEINPHPKAGPCLFSTGLPPKCEAICILTGEQSHHRFRHAWIRNYPEVTSKDGNEILRRW